MGKKVTYLASPFSTEPDFSLSFVHPEPPEGTSTTVGSFPPFSAFTLGRVAGARRAVGTLPRLCNPCLGGRVFELFLLLAPCNDS